MAGEKPKMKASEDKRKKVKQKTPKQLADELYRACQTLIADINKKKKEKGRKLTPKEIKEFSGFIKQIEIDICDLYCVLLQDQYQKTKNPLFVWEAFVVSRETSTGIQKWIMDYFSRCAAGLINIEKVSGRAAPTVYSALEMKSGTKGVFNRYQRFKLELRGCHLVLKIKKENPKRKLYEDIYKDVGKKFSVSRDTIKSWHRKHKKFIEPIVDLEVYDVRNNLKGKSPFFGILYNPPSK